MPDDAIRLSDLDVTVGGVRSPVVTAGPGDRERAVVFVHGNPGSGRDWQDLMAVVGGFARCVAPDMPGYAGADKPPDFDYTTDGYARHLAGILEQLGVRRADLVLHDLGGPWGLSWAAAHPAAIASLTFINIGALPGYRWHRFGRMYRTPGLGEVVLRTANRRGVAYMVRYGNRRHVPDAFVDTVLGHFRDPGTRRAVLRFYRATPDLGEVTVRAARALAEVNPPTLVIWGGRDPFVPVRFADEQRRFFRAARVEVLPESGHWPQVDDPERVAGLLVPFLRDQVA